MHDDIGAVIHSHAKFATMFAVVRQPIPAVIEEFQVYVGGDVPVAEYKETGSDALAEEVAKHVGDRSAVLMANHGLLTVGANPQHAMKIAALVERTAEIVWGARQLGTIHELPTELRDKWTTIYGFLRTNPM
jgi:L-fuculose-phosphate aldolase